MKIRNYDMLGLFSASLCLLHCAIFPLLLFFPIGISHNAWIDLIFLLLGTWSVYKVTYSNPLVMLKVLLWASVITVYISVLLDLLLHIHTPLIYIGAAGLIGGHIINFRNHRIRC